MWDQLSKTENPQLKYWSTIMELLLCCFIWSISGGRFPFLSPGICDVWFQVMDHTNYTRWLPAYVRDMVQLSEKHPDIHADFLKGNFVFQRSSHKFSLIGKDQSHELSNVKEFEAVLNKPTSNTALHEEAHNMQVKYRTDVMSFEIFEQLANPLC